MKSYRILIIDDDKDILELLKYNLEKEGYEVYTLSKGTSCVAKAMELKPDLIVLDIMMPRINGLEVCRQLRQYADFQNTYIFFLTALSDRQMRKEALELGGDDFIQKITGLRALTYKISTVLHENLVIRKSMKHISIGKLEIDRPSQEVVYEGRRIRLSEAEFEILYFFAQNPEREISRDRLLQNIWGSDVFILAKTLDVYLKNVARKVGVDLIRQPRDGQYQFIST